MGMAFIRSQWEADNDSEWMCCGLQLPFSRLRRVTQVHLLNECLFAVTNSLARGMRAELLNECLSIMSLFAVRNLPHRCCGIWCLPPVHKFYLAEQIPLITLNWCHCRYLSHHHCHQSSILHLYCDLLAAASCIRTVKPEGDLVPSLSASA